MRYNVQIAELQERLTAANARTEAAERDCIILYDQRDGWMKRTWDLEAKLSAAAARADAADAELAALRRYAADADKSTMERIAKIDQLEAQLAAVPVAAIDYVTSVADYPFGCNSERAAIAAWLNAQPEVQP